MNIQLELKPPTFTDFIYFGLQSKLKQESFNSNLGNVLVKDLTEEQAIEYAYIVKQAFLDHWKNKQTKQNREDEKICIR